ncbi:MAG: gamma-glutamylcyclotransferase [Halioglobus sp.]
MEHKTPRRERNLSEPTWVFGYGSLIYKVDFPFLEREIASIRGWQRRFWQGSHDHRGTPEAPGRVVTLVPAAGRICKGVAYLVDHSVFEHLDHREKNGYARCDTTITLKKTGDKVKGIVYVADRDNPAFLGPAPASELAAHIARSHGPSGSNRDYLLQLAEALRELEDEDPHVRELETLLSPGASR